MDKPFAFSYSKIKNFEACPKRYWHVDVKKDVKEEQSEQLLWGNEVHKHLANAIGKGKNLPPGFDIYQPWVDRVTTGPGQVLVEQQLAINAEFQPCEWFGKDAWFRGIADVLKFNGDVGLALDWKTGKILEDHIQLALMSACIFAHHPDIQTLRTAFVWLKEGDNITSSKDFDRREMPDLWRSLWPRITALKQAHEKTEFPPIPNRLCRKWCPVTQCQYHGE